MTIAVPENVTAWWSRRQRSKGLAVPYAVGTYRAAWARYPVLVRQYRPEYNDGRTLSQIPPAADVYLTWLCDAGHLFVATPAEQRSRPTGRRRRSVWCTVCSELASPRRLSSAPGPSFVDVAAASAEPEAPTDPIPVPARAPAARAPAARARRRPTTARRALRAEGARQAGEAFWSAAAPRPASKAEAELRQRLGERLEVDLTPNAVAVGRPFFDWREVWPDLVIEELRIAVEYDTVGRFGLEHVGSREDGDRRKDRLLREAGWEVVRIRCRPLQPLGAHDLVTSGVTAKLLDRLLDTFRELRGDLLVNAYLR